MAKHMKQKRYNPAAVEKKWQKVWKQKKTHEPNLKNPKKPFYNLMMFPYPSAEGLHAGNMYAFTGSDIYGRFKRMQGNDVFEPIGLDGFGIHSENYALKIGTHPMKQAKVSEKRFYEQLQKIGNGFAWNEHLETYDPEYYRWTQWVFVQMWKRGLAYRKRQAVNWCPSCKTVLADEQVVNGECERCGSTVVKKELEQWFFRITKYAERLLQNLEKLDWSEKVKIAQRNWIGKSEGAEIVFTLRGITGQDDDRHSVTVFTTRPDTLFGATFLVISPELAQEWMNVGWQASDAVYTYVNESLKRRAAAPEEKADDKSGVDTGIRAVNPANDEAIPVWVADYVLGGYGTGAIMAVPAHDGRDFAFAKQHNLPIRQVITGEGFSEDVAFEAEGEVINSGTFTGMSSGEAKWAIAKKVGGERKVQYRLRDWLISRQRYWGPPIPMIHCDACAQAGRGEQKDMPGWYAVPEKDLPVKLPMVKEFRPTGKDESPLASVKSFYEVKCPACKGKARRETDVSDTFLDSSWYFFRYIDERNRKQAFDPKRARTWLPVDMYIGGAEHSVLHLLYTRFVTMVFRDMKLISFDEPFKQFRAHGLIIKDGAKMSKSKGNVINPDEYIKTYGADVLRTYLMFLAPFQDGGDFQDRGIAGIVRFFDRIWRFYGTKVNKKAKTTKEFQQLLHQTVKKVTEDIESLHYNTAISALMVLFNAAETEGEIDVESAQAFVKLLNPFAPHLCQELWSQLGMKTMLDRETWPKWNKRLATAQTFELVIQVNSKIRARVEAPHGISEDDAVALALARPEIQSWVEGKEIRKKIYVENRLLNLIVG